MRETASDRDAIQCHVMKPIMEADLACAIRSMVDTA